VSTPTGMNEIMKQSLRDHLVRLVNDEPSRQRHARRNVALTASAGLALALGGVALGWSLGISNAPPPVEEPSADAELHQSPEPMTGAGGVADGGAERPYDVKYQFLGSTEVTLPPYPDSIIAEATFTCEDAGSLTVGGREARTCAAGESFTVLLELGMESAELPIVARDGQAWTFQLSYSPHDGGCSDTGNTEDQTQIVPGDFEGPP